MNYDHNKKFGLLKFHSGYGKFNLNSPNGYCLKIINAQTVAINYNICCVSGSGPPPSQANVSLGVKKSNNNTDKDASKNKKKDKGGKRKLCKDDISTPTDFRHVSHVGWDPNKGLDVSHGNTHDLVCIMFFIRSLSNLVNMLVGITSRPSSITCQIPQALLNYGP